MPSNVVQFPTGPHWRVLIAHQVGTVHQVLRSIIEAQHINQPPSTLQRRRLDREARLEQCVELGAVY